MSHPVSIENQTTGGVLHITWDDGIQQYLSHSLLRSRCQCADCKTIRLHSKAELPTQTEIGLTEIRLVGQYGVQLIFSDGHARGIYPWLYLRAISDPDEAT
jgi:DUF971 family protein